MRERETHTHTHTGARVNRSTQYQQRHATMRLSTSLVYMYETTWLRVAEPRCSCASSMAVVSMRIETQDKESQTACAKHTRDLAAAGVACARVRMGIRT